MLTSLWTVIIPKKLLNKKNHKLANLKQNNIVKNTKKNNMMKVRNFTPNCIPVKIALINTKVLLLNWFLHTEANIKQDIIKEIMQKVSEL